MNDNKSAHMADEYDKKIKGTIPNYDLLHSETINLVKSINPNPKIWLDTGCGTGNFLLLASRTFSATEFALADPSNPMIEIAKEKLSEFGAIKVKTIEKASTQDITIEDNCFDVITAIQAHHYLDRDGRKTATENCYRMLKTGGVFVAFENIRPLTDEGVRIGKNRWKKFQMESGKTEEEAQKHVDRFGIEFFPITIIEYIELLRKTGFSSVELFWYSYMQAGFYAIK
ncbi:MAG: class I SAM-dependent methyltransferase [Bacillota bacterium]|nr:class I SAM-dependent methyltransferase [Bacillota bacterium]